MDVDLIFERKRIDFLVFRPDSILVYIVPHKEYQYVLMNRDSGNKNFFKVNFILLNLL